MSHILGLSEDASFQKRVICEIQWVQDGSVNHGAAGKGVVGLGADGVKNARLGNVSVEGAPNNDS